jgi:hypothetical protein
MTNIFFNCIKYFPKNGFQAPLRQGNAFPWRIRQNQSLPANGFATCSCNYCRIEVAKEASTPSATTRLSNFGTNTARDILSAPLNCESCGQTSKAYAHFFHRCLRCRTEDKDPRITRHNLRVLLDFYSPRFPCSLRFCKNFAPWRKPRVLFAS